MVPWGKLKLYDDDPKYSFEEFCYRIAIGVHGNEEDFTRVDDSGGGDGVEFYLKLPNNDEWGWQSKFFHKPDGRISHKGRKRQIKQSLETSLKHHDNLKKWFLCTPNCFTPRENEWFDNLKNDETLLKDYPHLESLELVHWCESNFNTFLSEPSFAGVKNYFFGDLELDVKWFKTQFLKQISGNEFEPLLHVQTTPEKDIESILIGDSLIKELKFNLENLEKRFSEHNQNRKSNEIDLKPEIYIPTLLEFFANAMNLESSIQDSIIVFNEFITYLESHEFDKARILISDQYWSNLEKNFSEFEKSLTTIYSELNDNKTGELVFSEEDDSKVNIQELIDSAFRNVGYLKDYFFVLKENLRYIYQNEIHLEGKAGMGKTDIVSNLCNKLLNLENPAIFLNGISFNGNLPLNRQILNILDIPSNYSWNNFLEALHIASKVYKTRIPIIIDALNEASDDGKFSRVWEIGLKGLIEEISQYDDLIIITTFRETYKDPIWGDEYPNNIIKIKGFEDDDVTEKAILKYFDYYKIRAKMRNYVKYHFKHPLYLKLFCETKNPSRNEEVFISIGEYSLFEIFNEYLKEINSKICKLLDFRPGSDLVNPRLEKVGEYLFKENSKTIPFEKLFEILDESSSKHIKWTSSNTKAFLDESLLINRDWSNEKKDVFLFTYDLLAGYVIANYILKNNDINTFLNSKKTIKQLFSEKDSHPLHEDINRSLSSLLPMQQGIFIHELSKNQIAVRYGIEAFFEIPVNLVDNKIQNYLSELFDIPENRKWLLKLARHVFNNIQHPLNIDFWNNNLKKLSITERDLTWSEIIRNNLNQIEKEIDQFQKICQFNEITIEGDIKYCNLQAQTLMWYLTTNSNLIRDKSTKVLYWYSHRFPSHFFEILQYSMAINDPYVSERMLAATYGLLMSIHNDLEFMKYYEQFITDLGRFLFDSMFAENAPHSTTHILARDYGMRSIEIVLNDNPDLLTIPEQERIKPPFTDGGIREWGESEDKDKGNYRNGNDPLDSIVHEDLVSLLGSEMNKYKRPPAYLKAESQIRWRLYNLGYSLADFGDMDKSISYLSAIERKNPFLIDNYGRKYAKIAMYELSGYMDDIGTLNFDYKSDYARKYHIDIDPSFPEEIQHLKLIEENFLTECDLPVQEWVKSDYVPDLTHYLKLDNIDDEYGPWILMDSFISQTSEEDTKGTYIYSRGFFVKNGDKEEFIDEQEMSIEYIQPSQNNLYFGEVPWSDLYQESPWQEVELIKERNIQTGIKKQVFLTRDGSPLTFTEEKSFWDDLNKKIDIHFMSTEFEFFWKKSKMSNEFIKHSEEILEKEEIYKLNPEKIDKVLIQINFRTPNSLGTHESNFFDKLQNKGYDLSYIKKEFEQEKIIHEEYEILFPINTIESDLTVDSISAVDNKVFINKQICSEFNLAGQPQSFDLFERDGNKASFITYADSDSLSQRLIYLRKDLLDKYLETHDYSFFWVIWGAMQYYTLKEIDEISRFGSDSKDFMEINHYDPNQIIDHHD